MASPYLTAEGVKVTHRTSDQHWLCGMCQHDFGYSYGFDERACPVCQTYNRADFSSDLVSERLALLMEKLDEASVRFDSVTLMNAAGTIASMLEEVRMLEKNERSFFAPIVTLSEPLPDPRLPRDLA